MDPTSEWEPIKSRGRLIYWCRTLPDGGWLTVAKGDDRWLWTRRLPHRIKMAGGNVWYDGARSTARLARAAADRAVADPDRYGPTDTCESCGLEAYLCGHRRPETRTSDRDA